MTSMHGLAHRGNRNRALAVVGGNDAPASPDFLRAEYRRALERWCITKSDVDRRAVREAYKRFAATFCDDDAFIEAEATRIWGDSLTGVVT